MIAPIAPMPARPPRRPPSVALLAVAILGLCACAPEDITPTEPMALDGTSLTIEALPQEPCDPSKPYAVRVRWAVSDWDTPKFDFHIGSSQGQLWARENRAEGEKDSDAFVTPGLWFLMIDRNGRMVVAATPAPALVCPPA